MYVKTYQNVILWKLEERKNILLPESEGFLIFSSWLRHFPVSFHIKAHVLISIKEKETHWSLILESINLRTMVFTIKITL